MAALLTAGFSMGGSEGMRFSWSLPSSLVISRRLPDAAASGGAGVRELLNAGDLSEELGIASLSSSTGVLSSENTRAGNPRVCSVSRSLLRTG